MNKPRWTSGSIVLILLPIALLTLLALSLAETRITEWLFVHTTYYLLMATVLCWAGTYLHAARDVPRVVVVAWLRENWPGIVVALAVTLIAWHAVEPALRMLSDEANLVGTSKNLFASQTATFTVSGKYYYDSYWDIEVAIDQRPTLFPFLVSLVHVVRGYSHANVFVFNLMLLPAFVLLSYRLAKSLTSSARLTWKPSEGFQAFPRPGSAGPSPASPPGPGGETFGIVASLLVVAHPITLLSARSGGFDFLAACFALLVLKSLADYCREPAPARLAILWMNLCMFAEIRYESALFVAPVVGLLLLFRMVSWSTLRPYALVYALSPAFFMPRLWQAVLRGSVPRQDPGTVAFSIENVFHNLYEYAKPLLSPFHSYPAHSRVVIALGIVGGVLWLASHHRELFAKHSRFPVFVLAWMLLQATILFAYAWGRAQNPAAARLFIPIDTFFSFTAAWALVRPLQRWRPFVAILLAAAVLPVEIAAASQHRMLNRLTQTRENATTWRFFASLHEKRILIVTDRPSHYTIMGYGAMSFAAARNDPFIFEALTRRLFYDIYVVQQVKLSTNEPLPGYDLWPERARETMLEFQNDADVLIRISRVRR